MEQRMETVGIRYAHYALGRERVWYRDIPGIEAKIGALRIPDDEQLWGWGFFHRCPDDYGAHIRQGFEDLGKYLDRHEIDIDAVIACAPCAVNGATKSAAFVHALRADVLAHMRCAHANITLLEGYECVGVLKAIQSACAMVRAGARNVLVLAAEKVDDEIDRFQKFSIFSDFCFGLIVSGQSEHVEFDVVAARVQMDSAPGTDTSGVFARSLEAQALTSILGSHGIAKREVEKLFYLNFYEPIAASKVKAMGLRAEQLYTGNARELGHCCGADPLINLSMFSAARAEHGWRSVLLASGRTHAGVCIVQKCEAGRWRK